MLDESTAWHAKRYVGRASLPAPPLHADGWSTQLASRLFCLPVRWGWAFRSTGLPQRPAFLDYEPVWEEPAAPNLSQWRNARASIFENLFATVVVGIGTYFAYTKSGTASAFVHREVIGRLSGDTSLVDVEYGYRLVVLVIAGILALCGAALILKAVRLSAAISQRLRKFRAAYDTQWEDYQRRFAQWNAARDAYERALMHAEYQRDYGPQWFPACLGSDPARVDVFGGDHGRHGWASLLVTVGTSVLASGQRVTVLDLTGHDVAGGLVAVAAAKGMRTHHIVLGPESGQVDLLGALPRHEVADCLAYALTTPRDGADLRHERALTTEVLRLVLECLDETVAVTLPRLAAGVQVLRQTVPGRDSLTTEEVSRLSEHVGDIGRDEWSAKHLRLVTSQLTMLAGTISGNGDSPVAATSRLSVVATPAGRDDRKELTDRLLVQWAQHAIHGGRLDGLLVVAGVDHLGGDTYQALGEYARRAGVRLIVLADQIQGHLEKVAGTGGVACFMKTYNHRDAAVVAEFIGREHKFVVNQKTVQTGTSFTSGTSTGTSDTYNTGTSRGTTTSWANPRSNNSSTTESRGRTWSDNESNSTSQSQNESTSSGRVYEFCVEPQQIMEMPTTALIIVDNTSHGRRLVMADVNPGISLLNRVSHTPA